MSTDAPLLPDPATLPDDPAVLKALVVQLLEELQKVHARLQRQEHHMHLLLKKVYGRTSEKSEARQGLLFDPNPSEEEEASSRPLPESSQDTPVSSSNSKGRDRHGRGRITGSSAAATVVAERRPSTSACWHPASVTATTRGPTTATFSPGYQPCFPTPPKKTFSTSSRISGNRPNKHPQPAGPDFTRPQACLPPNVFRGTLT